MIFFIHYIHKFGNFSNHVSANRFLRPDLNSPWSYGSIDVQHAMVVNLFGCLELENWNFSINTRICHGSSSKNWQISKQSQCHNNCSKLTCHTSFESWDSLLSDLEGILDGRMILMKYCHLSELTPTFSEVLKFLPSFKNVLFRNILSQYIVLKPFSSESWWNVDADFVLIHFCKLKNGRDILTYFLKLNDDKTCHIWCTFSHSYVIKEAKSSRKCYKNRPFFKGPEFKK